MAVPRNAAENSQILNEFTAYDPGGAIGLGISRLTGDLNNFYADSGPLQLGCWPTE
jgi:hypothetical protein